LQKDIVENLVMLKHEAAGEIETEINRLVGQQEDGRAPDGRLRALLGVKRLWEQAE
jgi:hypothetical protein